MVGYTSQNLKSEAGIHTMTALICNARFSKTKGDTLIRPLQFIEFLNNDKEFLGMLDSGAQINVISDDLLSSMQYEDFEYLIKSARGVSGKPLPVIGWARVPMIFRNGKMTAAEFAVVSGIKSTILLGLPILHQTKSVLDPRNLLLTMPEGPVQILEGKQVPQVSSIMSVDIELDRFSMPKLTPEERKLTCQLLIRYQQLWKACRRGEVKDLTHTIVLNTDRPLKSRARQFCQEHRDAIASEVQKMLADKVIRLSNSPYSSELVLVRKKDGGWRMCVDYRLINQHTIPDNYPFPRIPDLLRTTKGASYFATLDLRSGYWQIPIEENSKSITAFRCPNGLYEFEVMPFGLTNAPATFQRAMDLILGDLYQTGVSVYLDDILIFGTTFEATYGLLAEVFRRLAAAGFTINLEKSTFFLPEIEYLGHVIAEGNIKPNPERVRSLNRVRPPSTVKELRSILGMFGYYQSYVPNFSETVAPLTNALRGVNVRSEKRIVWTEEMDYAIKKVAMQLADAVLMVPIDSDHFLVETDASETAIAGILNVKRKEKWEPVQFISKKLSGAQLNWPIREKEAFAIIYCLQKFDPFLRTRAFVLHTDHQSLQWLQDAKVGKLARWASRLAEYQMKIYWKKGSELVHVDCLSRYIEPDDDIQDRMIYQVVADPAPLPNLTEILAAQPGELPEGRGYLKRGDILYYRNGIWPPETFRTKIIAACHSLPPYCHPGVRRTKSNILKVFNWAGLHEDVTRYVRACLICQRSRPGLERLQGIVHTHPIPGVFQTVYLDFWHAKYRREPRVVLTMIDQATKWVEAVPIPNQIGDTVAEAFLQSWVCRFGVPHTIITDNDSPLVGDILRRLAGQLGIRKLRTTPYHPEGNAPVEAFHRTLNRRLTHFENETKFGEVPFPTALQLILWSYRAVIHSTMGESPAFLVYGIDPRSPIDNDWRMMDRTPEKDRVKFLNLLREDTQFRAFQRLKWLNDRKQRIDVDIAPGDLVLVRQQHRDIIESATRDQTATKLVSRWGLPCRVLRPIYQTGNRFLVSDILTGREREVHITDIRAISPPQDDQQRQEWSDLIAEEIRKTMFDPTEREQALKRFWVSVDQPQAKRHCTRSLRGDDE
jgi:transposase InsO family protein